MLENPKETKAALSVCLLVVTVVEGRSAEAPKKR